MDEVLVIHKLSTDMDFTLSMIPVIATPKK